VGLMASEARAPAILAARDRGRRGKRGRGASAALHLSLLFATAIALFPMLWILLSSFKPNEVIKTQTNLDVSPDPWTLENYRTVLTQNDHEFLHWLLNSVVVALLTTVVGVFLAATAAYAFSRYRFPGYRAALMSFLVAQMFPGVILLVPIYKIVVDLGLLNSKAALVLAYSTIAVPFCVWMLKGYFDTIPISLEEAGKIDGLTPFGTFWRIVLPLSLPGIAVTSFYMFITAWNEVLFANVFLTETKTYTLPIGLRTYIFQFEQQYGWLTAGAVIVTIPAVIMFLLAQRYLVSGLTRGGVKG
jgi:arabinogalactan oligomer/maltooligosaccharide transport system permease protein